MKVNVGTTDRIIRAVIGLALILGSLSGAIGLWGWIGIVFLVTAGMSFCPAYALLGLNSCPTTHRTDAEHST